jgi:hypothetical protein
MKLINFFILLFSLNASVYAQDTTKIIIPTFQDAYSATVKTLEAGEIDIDYQQFRESFLESEQFKIARAQKKEVDSLQTEMYKQMQKRNSQSIIKITKQILSIDYTNLMAHKILRQTYKIIGDTANAQKYKTIQFGLLNSIVKAGDGKACATGWPVIQIEEEYFMLKMLDATLIKQSVENLGNKVCDKMEVLIDGETKIYYFDASRVFASRIKLLEKK